LGRLAGRQPRQVPHLQQSSLGRHSVGASTESALSDAPMCARTLALQPLPVHPSHCRSRLASQRPVLTLNRALAPSERCTQCSCRTRPPSPTKGRRRKHRLRDQAKPWRLGFESHAFEFEFDQSKHEETLWLRLQLMHNTCNYFYFDRAKSLLGMNSNVYELELRRCCKTLGRDSNTWDPL
jgi:hypothetical protein